MAVPAFPETFPVKFPVPFVKKRFVVEALVAKRFVVVAEVPVAFMNVKFWMVEEPLESKFPKVPKPELFWMVEKRVVAKKLVVVA